MQNELNRVRNIMSARGADAILISSRENRFYFSGFTGKTGALLITKQSQTLFVDSRYRLQAAQEVRNCDVVDISGGLYNALNDTLLRAQAQCVMFEDKSFTVFEYEGLRKNLNVQQLLPLGDALLRLRATKNETELELMRAAAEITDKTFESILSYLRPGVTEREVALEIELQLRKNGADAPAFEADVTSGIRTSLVHALPSEKQLEEGDLIMLDFGAKYGEYCVDMTRTVALGHVEERVRELYNIVMYAQLKGVAAAKSGTHCAELDRSVREGIASFGYGDGFVHGTGHGVGLSIREIPSISRNATDALCTGMVVSIGPGVYQSSFGGIRIADTVVVGEEGGVVLTQSPKELLVI